VGNRFAREGVLVTTLAGAVNDCWVVAARGACNDANKSVLVDPFTYGVKQTSYFYCSTGTVGR